MTVELSCHQNCGNILLEGIRERLVPQQFQNVTAVAVDPIHFQDDDNSPPRFANPAMGEEATTTYCHRFLVTVVAPCHQAVEFSTPSEQRRNDGNLNDFSSLSVEAHDYGSSLLANETLGLSSESIIGDSMPSSGEINDQLDETIRGLNDDILLLGNDMNANGWENELTEQSTMDLFDDDDALVGDVDGVLYSMCRSESMEAFSNVIEMEATSPILTWSSPQENTAARAMDNVPKDQIANEEQTSVGSTTLVMSEFSSSQSEQQYHQQQSNEISSSTWDNFGHSTTQHQSPNAVQQMPPQQNNYANFGPIIGFNSSNGMNAMTSGGQQLISMCPATLPAVSALINGGTNGGLPIQWPLSQPLTYAAKKPLLVSVAKQVNSQKPGNSRRPAMLLPKPKSGLLCPSKSLSPATVSKAGIPRSRKTSPTLIQSPTSTVTGAIPNGLNDGSKVNVPEDHTTKSWIIHEGLTKVRQQRKQERKASSHQRKKGKPSSKSHLNQGPTQADNETSISVPIVAVPRKQTIAYACPLCGKSYGSANGLKYHAANGHGSKNTYTCDICQKTYTTRHGLAAHIRSHQIQEAAAGTIRREERGQEPGASN